MLSSILLSLAVSTNPVITNEEQLIQEKNSDIQIFSTNSNDNTTSLIARKRGRDNKISQSVPFQIYNVTSNDNTTSLIARKRGRDNKISQSVPF